MNKSLDVHGAMKTCYKKSLPRVGHRESFLGWLCSGSSRRSQQEKKKNVLVKGTDLVLEYATVECSYTIQGEFLSLETKRDKTKGRGKYRKEQQPLLNLSKIFKLVFIERATLIFVHISSVSIIVYNYSNTRWTKKSFVLKYNWLVLNLTVTWWEQKWVARMSSHM